MVLRHSAGQSPATIAKRMSLLYQTVRYHLLLNPKQADPALLAALRERVETAVAIEQGDPLPADTFEPEIQTEVEGCIELARQVANKFGLTTRNFLHRCIVHPNSK